MVGRSIVEPHLVHGSPEQLNPLSKECSHDNLAGEALLHQRSGLLQNWVHLTFFGL
jgi:hypothetical protein